jgi:hypothetical protein
LRPKFCRLGSLYFRNIVEKKIGFQKKKELQVC